MSLRRLLSITTLPMLLALGACSSQPPVPDWQMNARGSLDRATEAWLRGDDRIEAAEFARARRELQSTGQPALLARAELRRCATRVAALVFEACSGYAALAIDAPAPEQAYSRYLDGLDLTEAERALLPEAQRHGAAGLASVADPLSRLVAAGVLMRRGQASPDVLALAVDTASAQGWRRPLLAWLGVQRQRALAAGATDEAARLQRRMNSVTP